MDIPSCSLIDLLPCRQDEIIAWVAAQEDGTNAGFVFGVVAASAARRLWWYQGSNVALKLRELYQLQQLISP